MHPAYTVIFFTVSSGFGFGLLFLLGLAPIWGLKPIGTFGWAGFVLGFGLAVGGLLSSTRHLGHPERAWRALTQWRSSWLSREGVFAIACLALNGIYALGALFFDAPLIIFGVLSAMSACAVVYATGMIYAQLRTVQRWNSPLTPACYLLFSLSGGLMIVSALRALNGSEAPLIFTILTLAAAWIVKIAHWKSGDDALPLSTPESATGLGGIGTVRLLESPHSSESYLQTEMGYQIARKHAVKLRWISASLGGLGPILLLILAAIASFDALWLTIATLMHLLGMLTERWLFFAEAKHAVMNYYT